MEGWQGASREFLVHQRHTQDSQVETLCLLNTYATLNSCILLFLGPQQVAFKNLVQKNTEHH